MSQLNIALVGAGRRGRGAHLPVLAKMTDVYRLVAVCDMDPQTAQEVAEEYDIRAYTSVRDLVQNESLDVADVCVPAGAHHPICCFLADAGVNVICETPIAVSLPTADMMIEAARRNHVKLEIAENYYRAPMARFKTRVIESGVIGEVIRVYRIFYEGGAHGMSMMRHLAGGNPTAILGVTASHAIEPITDRMKRHHTAENWTMAVIDFDNGASAIQIYSNVIHARSLGRGQTGIDQIDGTRGTLIGEAIYLVPPDEMHAGARAVAYQPRRVYAEKADGKVLERIEVDLPETQIVWHNPFTRYGLSEGQIAVCDELMSIAQAVLEDKEPEYGAQKARQDVEMTIAMQEASLRGRTTIPLPLTELTETEKRNHAAFEDQFGYPVEDVESLVDVFFPRR